MSVVLYSMGVSSVGNSSTSQPQLLKQLVMKLWYTSVALMDEDMLFSSRSPIQMAVDS